jgi:hypothetical protein
MKLSNVSLDLKSLVFGAVVGGVVMLLVGAGTTTVIQVPAKWEYKVAAVQNLPRVGGQEQRDADQAFLNELGKDGWELVSQADGRVFYFKRSTK